MWRSKRWMLLLGLLIAPAARAADEPPVQPAPQPEDSAPAEQYKAIVSEYQAARQDFFDQYNKAQTEAEKQKLIQDQYPQPVKYAKRILQVAKDHPGDPVAVDALVWVVSNGRGSAEFDEALAIVADHQLESDKLGPLCSTLVYSPSIKSEELLRSAMEKNPHHEVKGLAAYGLAKMLAQQVEFVRAIQADPSLNQSFEVYYGKEYAAHLAKLDADAASLEAERLLETVVESYDDVDHYRGSLADAAGSDLFEIRNLAIGKTAPDIEGEDIDGASFKLSDYRGKVVVIDFWGHW